MFTLPSHGVCVSNVQFAFKYVQYDIFRICRHVPCRHVHCSGFSHMFMYKLKKPNFTQLMFLDQMSSNFI